MSMTWIWTAIVALSVLFGILNGNISQVGAAAMEGAGAAVQLCIGICGVICLWTGVMEVIRRAGLCAALSRILRPVLSRLFPESSKNRETIEAVSANVSANLLGLGNAATPLGIKAAGLMAKGGVSASDEICMLTVLNTASIQLIPVTITGVLTAAGSSEPFAILPAVWLSSLCSVTVGIAAARLFARIWRK